MGAPRKRVVNRAWPGKPLENFTQRSAANHKTSNFIKDSLPNFPLGFSLSPLEISLSAEPHRLILIWLSSNSLVVVERESNLIKLRLAHGVFEARDTGPVESVH